MTAITCGTCVQKCGKRRGICPAKFRDGDIVVTAQNSNALRLLLSGAALCSNAKLLPRREGKRYTVLGDPTEACLSVVAKKGGIDLDTH